MPIFTHLTYLWCFWIGLDWRMIVLVDLSPRQVWSSPTSSSVKVAVLAYVGLPRTALPRSMPGTRFISGLKASQWFLRGVWASSTKLNKIFPCSWRLSRILAAVLVDQDSAWPIIIFTFPCWKSSIEDERATSWSSSSVSLVFKPPRIEMMPVDK